VFAGAGERWPDTINQRGFVSDVVLQAERAMNQLEPLTQPGTLRTGLSLSPTRESYAMATTSLLRLAGRSLAVLAQLTELYEPTRHD
jgi:hypothetical protein